MSDFDLLEEPLLETAPELFEPDEPHQVPSLQMADESDVLKAAKTIKKPFTIKQLANVLSLNTKAEMVNYKLWEKLDNLITGGKIIKDTSNNSITRYRIAN